MGASLFAVGQVVVMLIGYFVLIDAETYQILKARGDQYKVAALQAKRAGDTANAGKLLRTAKVGIYLSSNQQDLHKCLMHNVSELLIMAS